MRKIIKLLAWNVVVFLVLLAGLELYLKIQRYTPGMIFRNDFFNKVDDLIVYRSFTTDASGILKIDEEVRTYIEKSIQNELQGKEPLKCFEELYEEGAYAPNFWLWNDYADLAKGELQNDFSRFITSLKNKEVLTEIDSAYLAYVHSPINEDGFRSIAFKNYKTDKKKILLLGDSFTWGHVTDNKTSSFADVLAAQGHVVFNTGITATDIPQYWVVAEKYIEKLEPDVVIANVYMGNDIAEHERIPHKDVPVYYVTNAGFLNSFSEGLSLRTADSIYQHLLGRMSIPEQDKNYFNWFMGKSRVTTQLWPILTNFSSLNVGPWPAPVELAYNKVVKDNYVGYSVNRKYLQKIENLAQQHNSRFIAAIIPQVINLAITQEELNTLLDHYPNWYKPDILITEDYTEGYDGHFNESGHRKFGLYLDSLIRHPVAN